MHRNNITYKFSQIQQILTTIQDNYNASINHIHILAGGALITNIVSQHFPSSQLHITPREFASIGAAFIAANISKVYHTKNVDILSATC